MVFVGSRACAANHYVIVEKCGYPEMYVHIFDRCRSGVGYIFRIMSERTRNG